MVESCSDTMVLQSAILPGTTLFLWLGGVLSVGLICGVCVPLGATWYRPVELTLILPRTVAVAGLGAASCTIPGKAHMSYGQYSTMDRKDIFILRIHIAYSTIGLCLGTIYCHPTNSLYMIHVLWASQQY